MLNEAAFALVLPGQPRARLRKRAPASSLRQTVSLHPALHAPPLLLSHGQAAHMVTITIEGSELILEVEGLDKLWSLRSRLTIPLEHVRGVRPEPEAARRWFHGIKVAGTNLPGFLAAGTFYHEGGLVFWDVHDPDKAIAIDLSDERYQRLIVEVADPAAAVRLLARHLPQRGS